MNDLLLKLIGVPEDVIPENASPFFMLSLRAPQSVWWFVLLAAVALGVWGVMFMYRREITTCPKPVRIALGAVRCAVLLLLVLIFLGPMIGYNVQHRVDPLVVLAIDDSQSIGAEDRYLDDDAVGPLATALGESASQIREEKYTRAQVIHRLLSHDKGGRVRELAEKGKLRVVFFSDEAREKETKPRYFEADLEAGTVTEVQQTGIIWEHLRYVAIAAAAVVLLCIAVAIIRQSAGWMLIAAVPVTVCFAAVTLLIEQNHEKSIASLFWMENLTEESEEKPEEDTDTAPVRPAFDPAIPQLEAKGPETNYARVIRASLKWNPAAIVLVGDGQSTAASDDYKKATAEARENNIPIFTLGVGDISRQRRLEVARVSANDKAWRGDPFEVQAVVSAKAMANRPITVQLFEQVVGDEGSETVLDAKQIQPSADDFQQPVMFTHTPSKEGSFKYIVRVSTPKQGDEHIEGDPQGSATVDVVSQKVRVLLVSSSPTWQYRTLHVLLTRDKTIDVSCWLQSMDPDVDQEGDTTIKQLPYSKKDLSEYNVIMLMDPDPTEFTTTWMEHLEHFVSKKGGGLLFVAGPKFTTMFLNRFSTPLAVTEDSITGDIKRMLPVRFGTWSDVEIGDASGRYDTAWPLRVVPANMDQAIMRFDPDPQINERRWQRMPPIFWSFPAVGAKSATRTLIEHSNPAFRTTQRGVEVNRPLLVAGRYGSGRTLYMGFDGTWRWRRVGKNSEYFARYWVQTVRYLTEGRSLGSKNQGVVLTPKRRYNVGEEVVVTARLEDAEGEPLTDDEVEAVLELTGTGVAPRGFKLRNLKDEDSPGKFEGTIQVLDQGESVIKVTLLGASSQPVTIESNRFLVELSRVEFVDRRLDENMLRSVAEGSGGGQYFRVDEIDKIAAAVPDDTTRRPIPGKPYELWSNIRLWYLLALLLTIEWGTRKRWKLM